MDPEENVFGFLKECSEINAPLFRLIKSEIQDSEQIFGCDGPTRN